MNINMKNKEHIAEGIKGLFKQKGEETFASRLHHYIACWFVGSPQRLNVPDEFWLDDDCRTPPTREDYDKPGVAGQLIEVETFRRDMRWKLARVAPVFFFIAISGVWVSSQGLGTGIVKAKSAANTIATRLQADTVVSAEEFADYTNSQVVEEIKNSLASRGASVQEVVDGKIELTPRETSLADEMNKRGIRPEELL